MPSIYSFNTATNPIEMYEWDDGMWKIETLSLNEALTINDDGSITLTKTYSNYLKLETFALTPDVNDAAANYYQVSETYTDLIGNPLQSEPGDDEEGEIEDEDGIEDDQDGDGSDDDLIDGTDDDDLEHGGAGDDEIDGADGDDDIYGEEGDDDLIGGLGDDLLVGGVGFDVLSGGVGNDNLDGGDDDDLLEGGEGADLLNGGNGDDELYAGSGNDTVNGGAGDDLIIGGDGAGNDFYVGGAGSDTVKYSSATAGITVNLIRGTAQSTSTDSGIGIDKLSGIENIIGGQFNDILTGSSSSNRIEGGDGNDLIIGGLGKDILVGGNGSDTFKFNSAVETKLGVFRDVIEDFQSGDKIDLSAIDAKAGFTKNDAFTFIESAPTKANCNGVLWFADGVLYGSTDRDVAPEFAIQMTGVLNMSQSAFIA